jgi:Protein kinase domain
MQTKTAKESSPSTSVFLEPKKPLFPDLESTEALEAMDILKSRSKSWGQQEEPSPGKTRGRLLSSEEEAKGTLPRKPPSNRLSKKDFDIVKHLGRGSYADVFMVKNKHTNKIYALKKIDKQFLGRQAKEHQAFIERMVLSKLHHPGLIRLHATFQTRKHLCFVLDYMERGEFSDLIKHHFRSFFLIQAKNWRFWGFRVFFKE